MNKNKKTFFIILLALVLILPIVTLAQAPAGDPDITAIKGQLESTVFTIGTSIIVIGWIITGILFLMAQGAPEKMVTARKALIYTVVGTVLIVIAKTSTDAMDLIQNAITPGG